MFALSKAARLSLALALAMVLCLAGVARASHEAHAPTQVFFLSDGNSSPLSGANCLSFHVDEDGAPVLPVHIHACADCLFAVHVIAAIDPPSTVILRLEAAKRLTFDPRPPRLVPTIERFSSRGPRAPPFFS